MAGGNKIRGALAAWLVCFTVFCASLPATGETAPTNPLTPAVSPALKLHTENQNFDSLPQIDGFELPLQNTEFAFSRGEVGKFELSELLTEAQFADLNLEQSRIEITEADIAQNATVTTDLNGKQITIQGVGRWELNGSTVLFTPASVSISLPQRINFIAVTNEGFSSQPAILTVQYPRAENLTHTASEGVVVEIPMGLDPALVDLESFSFSLDALPSGSAVTRDGKKLILPKEGTWVANPTTATITFTPRRERLGASPSEVKYQVEDFAGRPLPMANIKIETPSLPAIVRSSPYGQVVEYNLASYAQNIDPQSYELVPYSSDLSVEKDGGKQLLRVPEQGIWELDPISSSLKFTPADEMVREVTPIGIRGKNAQQDSSTVAPVSVGYPQVLSVHRAFTWGSEAVFQPLSGSLHSQSDTLRFTLQGMPVTSQLSENGRTLVVPGEGTWAFDTETLNVTFTPVAQLATEPTPLTYQVAGVYAGNETTGVLTAQYADAVPISRDDEAVTSSQLNAINIDVLANDSPASSTQALDPSTLLLRSASSSNIEQLIAGSGTRLVIPDEGTFEITNAGSVRFTPVSGFAGRTTPIDYSVEDSKGLRSSARLIVEVEPQRSANATVQNSGINGVFARLLPGYPQTFSMFVAIVGLLIFTGIVALWVGRAIELLKENR